MLRLIGILTGSAFAVAVLIVALGLPRFSPPDDVVRATEPEPESASPAIVTPVEAEPMAAEPDTQSEEPVDEPLEPPLSEAETEALIDDIFAPQPVAADAPVSGAPAVDENWYAFWSPFRSEIAANGFIARLQETTGIDYRVVKVKTGVYEVAFAFVDDADIQDKLARISDATGLDMTGG